MKDPVTEYVDQLSKRISVLKAVSRYKFEFGVFSEDGKKTVSANIVNTDGTVSKTELAAADAMYFIEYGTLMIPARPVLQEAMSWANLNIEPVLNQICCGVMNNGWSEAEIRQRLEFFAQKIERKIYEIISRTEKDDELISGITGKKNENVYVVGLKGMQKYISCRVVKQ
jgi:hypothetical protein